MATGEPNNAEFENEHERKRISQIILKRMKNGWLKELLKRIDFSQNRNNTWFFARSKFKIRIIFNGKMYLLLIPRLTWQKHNIPNKVNSPIFLPQMQSSV